MEAIPVNGQTVTFYSYKGGVGRSMALVNIACLAAKEKKKVLLIDCDLEAPGLHQFFKTADETYGFVDLVTDINTFTDVENNNNEEGYARFMEERFASYVDKNVSPFTSDTNIAPNAPMEAPAELTNVDDNISVDVIKAGRFDDGYSKKLGSINWIRLYEKAPAFFRTFAIWLETKYDYIFVDARTGLADTSGICTMLMPQKLVMVFVLNKQNINGVVDVARQAIEYRYDSNDCRRLDIYPLPSRIENSVNPYLQLWIDNYKTKFVNLFTEKYKLNECRLSPYFDRCFIQYYPIHAYGENIPSLTESVTSPNFITYNYNSFYTVLKKNLPAWEIISTQEEQENASKAHEHFRKGLDLFYKKEYKQAIAEYSNAINLKPDFTDAIFNRSLCYEDEEMYKEALLDLNAVIALETSPADAYNSRGNLLSKMNSYDDALKDYSRAIEMKPDYAEAYYNRGVAKQDLRNYEEAIKDYDKAIELKPDYVNAYYNKGVSKSAIKMYDAAVKDYDKAIELKPDYAEAYYGRGVAFGYLKQYDNETKDYNKAIELKPDYAEAYNNRGASQTDMKRYEEATKDYNKAIELLPDYAEAYSNRGIAEEAMKMYDAAIKDYSKAIELNPNYINAYSGLAYLHMSLKMYDEAVKNFNVIIAKDPDNADALNGLANVYKNLQQFDKAKEYNEKCFLQDEGSWLFWGTKAEIDGAMGNDEGFYAGIEKAVELGLDLKKEVEEEPEIMNKYINQPRFQELLKKYNITLEAVPQ